MLMDEPLPYRAGALNLLEESLNHCDFAAKRKS